MATSIRPLVHSDLMIELNVDDRFDVEICDWVRLILRIGDFTRLNEAIFSWRKILMAHWANLE